MFFQEKYLGYSVFEEISSTNYTLSSKTQVFSAEQKQHVSSLSQSLDNQNTKRFENSKKRNEERQTTDNKSIVKQVKVHKFIGKIISIK